MLIAVKFTIFKQNSISTCKDPHFVSLSCCCKNSTNKDPIFLLATILPPSPDTLSLIGSKPWDRYRESAFGSIISKASIFPRSYKSACPSLFPLGGLLQVAVAKNRSANDYRYLTLKLQVLRTIESGLLRHKNCVHLNLWFTNNVISFSLFGIQLGKYYIVALTIRWRSRTFWLIHNFPKEKHTCWSSILSKLFSSKWLRVIWMIHHSEWSEFEVVS